MQNDLHLSHHFATLTQELKKQLQQGTSLGDAARLLNISLRSAYYLLEVINQNKG